MSTEVFKISLEDIVQNTDPKSRGDKPFLTVNPGDSEVPLTRIQSDETRSLIALVCDRLDTETRIYTLDYKTVLASYGLPGNRKVIIRDEDDDIFPFSHIATVFRNSKFPYIVRVEDEDSTPQWLLVKHV